ncbi:MAG TPA: hypothetical protein VND45_08550 [Thermoanaerobaculia bacterium]|jgi:hypothetical protein|nr:hypothetical protein [Thermoanaerobaculia bacterium]
MNIAPGVRPGPVEIVAPIAAGGTGEVYGFPVLITRDRSRK